jgi:hypothetical protein
MFIPLAAGKFKKFSRRFSFADLVRLDAVPQHGVESSTVLHGLQSRVSLRRGALAPRFAVYLYLITTT